MTTRTGPVPSCPIRPGEPCTLCQLDVSGPQDCGLVYLVMGDDELREGLHQARLARLRTRPSRPARDPAVARRSPAGS